MNILCKFLADINFVQNLYGYSFGIIIGGIFAYIIIIELWKFARPEISVKRHRIIAASLGAIERFVLILAFQINPLIVPAWLALRVASVWRGWEKSRILFNITLTGIGLNLVFSIISYKLIKLGIDSNCCFEIIISIFPIIFFLICYLILFLLRKHIVHTEKSDC